MTRPAPDVFLADCPARSALELIADTWSVVVLERAGARAAAGKKMLTQTLRRLADAGLVARPEVRGGDYALTTWASRRSGRSPR
ncbi:winged helix-turn-helix transcriptional regulator [Actinomycetospora sp. CA-101289]|uniref:winged helix-turn-helix transcriptional regulator n=1 Tax=Actinomycetospora sp. CA-101289 TaxID=3239893 RepID=UPI003D9762E7